MGRRLAAGVAGGLVGGVLFGLMMQAKGMMEMIAGLIEQQRAGTGWVVHLTISVVFGLIYALSLGNLRQTWGSAAGYGALYGAFWWVAGALLIMPTMMGMPVFAVGQTQMMSLIGHLLYGVALGLTYATVVQRTATPEPAAQHR